MSGVNQDNLQKTTKVANLPVFLPKFQESFDKCDHEIRSIFLLIVSKFLCEPKIAHRTVDKPDYRMAKSYIFCEMILQGVIPTYVRFGAICSENCFETAGCIYPIL
jgi:hypothetical protein